MPTDGTALFDQMGQIRYRGSALRPAWTHAAGAIRVTISDCAVTVGRPMSGGPDAAFRDAASWLGVTGAADR
jgi:hypothetical protein